MTQIMMLAIHGGAGVPRGTSARQQETCKQALRTVLESGASVLGAGGTALDAACEAVRLLEDNPLFNAGRGAVFTRDGEHELDASVMDGRTRACGAVAGIRTVRNPVLAARTVMEQSPHVLLIGDGAEAFARAQGLEMVAPDFFSTRERREQLEAAQRTRPEAAVLDHEGAQAATPSGPAEDSARISTVGAVALDTRGHLAAATSTGGLTNKWPGRVGDSPLIGAGCYADDATCAVSCTGTGEAFIRGVAAHDVAARMKYAGQGLIDAARAVVCDMLPLLEGRGGLIALDAAGNLAMPFNTPGMYRGHIVPGRPPQVAIWGEEALRHQGKK